MFKGIAIGFVLGVAVLGGGLYYYFAAGMAPVATADPPMPFERNLANMALDAHIEKQHIGPSPILSDESSFLAGAKVYKQYCAACHGLPEQPPSDYEARMGPKPTQVFHGKGERTTPQQGVSGRQRTASACQGCPPLGLN